VSVPTPRSDLTTRVVDEEVVILDRANGMVHRLNATAAAVWKLCDGRHDEIVIADQVAAAFDGTPEDVRRQVSRTIADFRQLGLLSAAGGGEQS
jgi:hypothetical protein